MLSPVFINYNIYIVKKIFVLSAVAILLTFSSCQQEKTILKGSGKLFIIGGGSKPIEMLNELIDIAGIRTDGYIYVLPMASSVPDSAIIWAKEDFRVTGIKKISGYNFLAGATPPREQLDSLKNAKLIYISGGDQSRFMSVVLQLSCNGSYS